MSSVFEAESINTSIYHGVLEMFIHGRLFLTTSGILLDEVKSVLQKSLRRKESSLALKATKELIGRGKDQLPWKCILTYMFEDHCLNDAEVLSILIERFKKFDKYGSIELILKYCGTCRIAACLPVIALEKQYEPVDWDVDVKVDEDLQDLVHNQRSRIDCSLLLQHLKTAWIEKHETHLITYMKLVTMVNDHDKVTVTKKGLKYSYYSYLTKKTNFVMIVLTMLSKVSKQQADGAMESYCKYCCFLATVKEAPLRLIISAAIAQYLHQDAVRHQGSLKLDQINWSTVGKLDSIPDWAVDKHTFRGRTGLSTKQYLSGKSEANNLSDMELEEFHGKRTKVDINQFLNEGVLCNDEIMPVNPYWERCKQLYLEKPKKLQKTVRMTAIYYVYLMKCYENLSGKKETSDRLTSMECQKRKRSDDFGEETEQLPGEYRAAKKAKVMPRVTDILKYFIKEVTTNELPCLDGPLLQVPTGSAKVYTRIDLQKQVIWKGPYSEKKISLALFFHRVLTEVFHCPHTLTVKRSGNYIQFPLLSGKTANFKVILKDFYDCISKKQVEKAKFIPRENLGIIQLHKLGVTDITRLPPSIWCHYLFRYVLNIGDSGLYNCLTDSQLSFLYGIDMEENRMAICDNKLLTLLFTKQPRKLLQDAILRSLQSSYKDVLQIMSEKFDIRRVKALSKFYNIDFDVTIFTDRIERAIKAINTQFSLC